MERHGHDQPALHHLQQPDPRRAAQSAGRRIPRSRILFVLCQQRTADFRPGRAAMRNKMRTSLLLASVLLIAGPASTFAAGSEADFKAAYAAAEAGDFDKAIASSKEAEALAKASIFQATSEKEAWKALEIR